ncbi:MAG: hypothetical protein GU357_01055 [Thermofilum sp.]|jgi:hypothetical protein|nr:hypothetical protein [Thermofilum sp.]
MLKQLGIKLVLVCRKIIGNARKKNVLKNLEEKAKKLSLELSHISDEDVVALIGEDREDK